MAQYAFDRLKPEYARLWSQMRVVKGIAATREARQVIANKNRYKAVEAKTGVPWIVTGVLHMRESGGDFHRWLHNGDPMKNRQGQPVRTRQVPAGRPPNPNITWEEGAIDALVYERLHEVNDWGPERVAYASEKFNGWGYRRPKINIPSPYLWGGTSVQKPGKFIEDHKYSATTMDPQLGSMAVLRMLMELDSEAAFAPLVVQPAAMADDDVDDVEESRSPKAVDAETQVRPNVIGLVKQSTTMKGALLSWGTALSGWFSAFIDKLHDPVYLTLFLVGVGVTCYATWLAVSGRINVEKLVAHLSQDTEDA